MSYARFSTDDHKSDVYAYMDDWGFVIHVAARRYNIPEAQYAALPAVSAVPQTPEEIIRALFDRENALHQLIEANRDSMAAIEHPLAGETVTFPTPGEAADKLEELQSEGLYVPQRAIDGLRETQEDFAESD